MRDSTVRIANGSCSKVFGSGSVQLSKDICLKSVLFVPALTCNLISVSKFNGDIHCTTKFSIDSCVFQEMTSARTNGNADLCDLLYLFKMKDSPRNTALVSPSSLFSDSFTVFRGNKTDEILLWHYRIVHPNFCTWKSFHSYSEIKIPSFFIVVFVNFQNIKETHIITT